MHTFLPLVRRTPCGFPPVWHRVAFGFFLLLLAPAVNAAEDTVLYPRSVAPPEAPAPPRSTGSNATLLLLALAAATAGGWLLWRQRRSAPGFGSRDSKKLAISETRSLGNRQYLVVADYDGRKFLLGVCPGRIDLLSPLDSDLPPKKP